MAKRAPPPEMVGTGGRARKLRDAEVAKGRHEVGAVVCVHAKDMKEAWRLAASRAEAPAWQIIRHYAERWTIEPGFRDTKDLRFGMGLGDLASAIRNGVTGFFCSTPSPRSADLAGRGWRKARPGPTAQSQHRQTADAFAVPPGLHALRIDPEHARSPLLRPLMERFGEIVMQNSALEQTFSVV